MNDENLEKRVPFDKCDPRINLQGRPKGSRNRSTIVKEWLSVQQKVKNPITGETETLDQADVITLALISKARKGDVAAFKELMDSGFGKNKEIIEQTVINSNLENLSTEELIKRSKAVSEIDKSTE